MSLILREGLTLACVGLGIGLIGAFLVNRTMQSTLYGIGKVDGYVLLLVSVALLTAAVLACLIPARRAVSIEPMQALRAE